MTAQSGGLLRHDFHGVHRRSRLVSNPTTQNHRKTEPFTISDDLISKTRALRYDKKTNYDQAQVEFAPQIPKSTSPHRNWCWPPIRVETTWSPRFQVNRAIRSTKETRRRLSLPTTLMGFTISLSPAPSTTNSLSRKN